MKEQRHIVFLEDRIVMLCQREGARFQQARATVRRSLIEDARDPLALRALVSFRSRSGRFKPVRRSSTYVSNSALLEGLKSNRGDEKYGELKDIIDRVVYPRPAVHLRMATETRVLFL